MFLIWLRKNIETRVWSVPVTMFCASFLVSVTSKCYMKRRLCFVGFEMQSIKVLLGMLLWQLKDKCAFLLAKRIIAA